MSYVEVDVSLRRGRFELAAAFSVDADRGGVTSLFGASGAGKTTLLRCLAGLEGDVRGRIVVDGRVWHDDAANVSVPAWRRPVGYVFQEAGLFAHLDVTGNLRFGERRVPARERRIAFDDVVGWLGLEPLLARRPASLSGGERQRVAVGRALLTSPRLLLMDEPLSALDEASRRRILPWFETLRAELAIPVLYVSHALAEVTRLCDDMVWLDGGRVRASGPIAELVPIVDAEAEDEGLSAVVDGTVVEHDDADRLSTVALRGLDGVALHVARLDVPRGVEVRVQVFARDVSVALDPEPRSSILNVLPATVRAVHQGAGGRVLLVLEAGASVPLLARITQRSLRALGLEVGTEVFARMKSVGVVGSVPRQDRRRDAPEDLAGSVPFA